jgi:ELWxxDGT repeat protein
MSMKVQSKLNSDNWWGQTYHGFGRWLFLLLVLGAAVGLAAGWVRLAAAQQAGSAPAAISALPAAGPAVLIKDIAPGEEPWTPGFPGDFITVGGVTYFNAQNHLGSELWRTDGTTAGTWMVKDIWPGKESSYPMSFHELNGWLLFWANDGTHGAELWRSDGTPEGTTLVKDMDPGADSIDEASGVIFNGALYFRGYDSLTGIELWRTDGTAEGTILVKDIWPGGGNFYNANFLAVANGKLFIFADDGVNGYELWVSDGTTAGTTLLKDIYPGPNGSWPSDLMAVGNLLLFVAEDGVNEGA